MGCVKRAEKILTDASYDFTDGERVELLRIGPARLLDNDPLVAIGTRLRDWIVGGLDRISRLRRGVRTV